MLNAANTPPPPPTVIQAEPVPEGMVLPKGMDAADYCILTLVPQGAPAHTIAVHGDGSLLFRAGVPGWLRGLEAKLRVSVNPVQVVAEQTAGAVAGVLGISIMVARDKISGDVLKAVQITEARQQALTAQVERHVQQVQAAAAAVPEDMPPTDGQAPRSRILLLRDEP